MQFFVAGVAQLVRAPVCGTRGRGFKSPHSPHMCASGGMVDALVLGTSGQPWGFESLLAHQ